jgi:hypothetical protein
MTTWRTDGNGGGKAAAIRSATLFDAKRWRSHAKSWWWARTGMPVSAMTSARARPRGRFSGMARAFSTTSRSRSNVRRKS